MDEQEKEIEEILGTFDKAPSPSSERNNQAQIRQNNLQSRQVSPKPIDTERTVRTFNQTSNKRQTPSGKGIYLSPKCKAVIKRRKRQSGFFKILKSKTLPRMHHNMRVSTVNFIRYLLNSFGVITTQLGSIWEYPSFSSGSLP